MIFTALYAFPYFLLLDSSAPVIWLATAIGLAIGPADDRRPARLLRRAVRRLGALHGVPPRASLGAALVGFSPLAAALLGALDGEPWLVAAWMVFASLVSLVAFLALG